MYYINFSIGAKQHMANDDDDADDDDIIYVYASIERAAHENPVWLKFWRKCI